MNYNLRKLLFLASIAIFGTPQSLAGSIKKISSLDLRDIQPCNVSLSPVGEAHKYLLQVGETNDDTAWNEKWEVVVRSRTDDKDLYNLVLNDSNSFPGQRVLTSSFGVYAEEAANLSGSICMTITKGDPPRIVQVAKIKQDRRSRALSSWGPTENAPPNFIAAKNIWRDCDGESDTCETVWPDSGPVGVAFQDKNPTKTANIWRMPPDPTNLSRIKRRKDAVKKAFGAIVFLELIAYEDQFSPPQLCTGADCTGRCTGFFVAPRLIATNAHCIWYENETFSVYGYLRPVGGRDSFGRRRPPDLQALTPMVVGENGGATDYAFLWVGDEDVARYPGLAGSDPEPRPLFAPISNNLSKGEYITIFGYPLFDVKIGDMTKDDDIVNMHGLIGSFDEFCAITAVSKYGIYHRCDTEKGNSGSPVFDREMTNVVGLHYGGFSWLPGFDVKNCELDDENENCPKNCSRNGKYGWKYCKNGAALFDVIKEDIENIKLSKFTLYDERPHDAPSLHNSSWSGRELIYALPGQLRVTNSTILTALRSLYCHNGWSTDEIANLFDHETPCIVPQNSSAE